MFEFKHHTKALSDVAKNNIAKTEEKYNPDLVFISKDNIKVSTHSSSIWMFSPYIRSILASVDKSNLDSFYISVPDFNGEALKNLKTVTAMAWDDTNVWSSHDIDLFETFNIDVGVPTINDKDTERKESDNEEEDTSFEMDTSYNDATETEKLEIVLDSDSSDHNEDDAENDNAIDVKSCPKCPKQFSGTNAKIRDSMRCHIGLDHLDNDLEILAEKTFSKDICMICQKTFKTMQRQKIHLLKTHKALADKLSILVNSALDDVRDNKFEQEINDKQIRKMSGTKSSKLNKFTANSDKNNSQREEIFDSIKTFETIFPTLTVDKSRKVILAEQVNKGLEVSVDMDSESNDDLENTDDPSVDGNTITENLCIQCTGCDKTWPTEKAFNSVLKNHVMRHHFGEGYECQERNYFQGSKCTFCDQKVSGLKRLHLYSVHAVLKEEVDKMFKEIRQEKDLIKQSKAVTESYIKRPYKRKVNGTTEANNEVTEGTPASQILFGMFTDSQLQTQIEVIEEGMVIEEGKNESLNDTLEKTTLESQNQDDETNDNIIKERKTKRFKQASVNKSKQKDGGDDLDSLLKDSDDEEELDLIQENSIEDSNTYEIIVQDVSDDEEGSENTHLYQDGEDISLQEIVPAKSVTKLWGSKFQCKVCQQICHTKNRLLNHLTKKHFRKELEERIPQYFEGKDCSFCVIKVNTAVNHRNHHIGVKHDVVLDILKDHLVGEKVIRRKTIEEIELIDADENIQNYQYLSDDEPLEIIRNNLQLDISDEEEDVEEDITLISQKDDDYGDIQRNLMLDQDISDDEEFEEPSDNSDFLFVKENLMKELCLSDEEEENLEDFSPNVQLNKNIEISVDDDFNLKEQIINETDF